jgi:hypothetical protein
MVTIKRINLQSKLMADLTVVLSAECCHRKCCCLDSQCLLPWNAGYIIKNITIITLTSIKVLKKKRKIIIGGKIIGCTKCWMDGT